MFIWKIWCVIGIKEGFICVTRNPKQHYARDRRQIQHRYDIHYQLRDVVAAREGVVDQDDLGVIGNETVLSCALIGGHVADVVDSVVALVGSVHYTDDKEH